MFHNIVVLTEKIGQHVKTLDFSHFCFKKRIKLIDFQSSCLLMFCLGEKADLSTVIGAASATTQKNNYSPRLT